MPKKIEIYRRAIKEAALKGLGIQSRDNVLFAGQVRLRGEEANILALPPYAGEVLGDFPLLQNPVTGNPYFMVDVSAVDGPDEIA